MRPTTPSTLRSLATPEVALPSVGATTPVDRIWDPVSGGPSPALVLDGEARDLSSSYAPPSATCARPLNRPGPPGSPLGDATVVLKEIPCRQPLGSRDHGCVHRSTYRTQGRRCHLCRFPARAGHRRRVDGDPEAATAMPSQVLFALGTDLPRSNPAPWDAQRLKEFVTEQGLSDIQHAMTARHGHPGFAT